MPTRLAFTVEATSPAPPSAVYRLLAEGASWPSWTPIGRFELEAEGTEGGESAGAVRAFISGPVRSREQLVELMPDRLVRYRVLSGPPLADHEAKVELSAVDGGTRIVWSEAFVPKVPGTGTVLRWFLTRFIQRCANGLAAAAQPTTDQPSTDS